jgi:hypothetical protein
VELVPPPSIGEILLPRCIGRLTQSWQLENQQRNRVVVQAVLGGQVRLAFLAERTVFDVTLQDFEQDWIPLAEVIDQLTQSVEPEELVSEEAPWIRAGARIILRGPVSDFGSSLGEGYMITGVQGAVANIREILDLSASPARLSDSTRTLPLSQILAQYRPWPLAVPPWLFIGAVITQVHDGLDYSVVGLDPLVGVMRATPREENRPVRFSLHRLEQSWRPRDTLTEVRPPRTGTPIVLPRPAPRSGEFLPPEWLQPGRLIRLISNRGTFWVNRLDNLIGKARLQKVERLATSMKITDSYQEVLYSVIEREFLPLDDEGYPLFEHTCPHCEEEGKRDREEEERRPDKVRAYRCSKHLWTFLADGSPEDGKLVPLTRFERDFEL